MELRNYTRWVQVLDGRLAADILGAKFSVIANPETGKVTLSELELSPDEARMLGVRLIEGAALADGDRAIRRQPGREGDEKKRVPRTSLSCGFCPEDAQSHEVRCADNPNATL